MSSNRKAWILAGFAVSLLQAPAAISLQTESASEPHLVKLTNRSGKSVVCELLEETGEHVKVIRLTTGKRFNVKKSDLADIQRGLADDEAIESMGFTPFAVWKTARATRTNPEEQRIAVLPLLDDNGVETDANRRLAEELVSRLARLGRPVVDRDQLAGLLSADRFDELFDRAFALRIGEQLGASAILYGTIVKKRNLQDTRLRLIDVATGTTLFTISHAIRTVAPTPTSLEQEADEYTIPEHATNVVFSPDSRSLATAGHDGTVKIWQASTGKHRFTLLGDASRVQDVAFSPDAKLLASASLDGVLKIWDLASGDPRKSVDADSGSVRALAFAPHGRILASGGDDMAITLWDVPDLSRRSTLEGHEKYIRSLDFAHSSRLLASASNDRTIKLWDADSGRSLATLKGHTGFVYRAVFSPDDRLLASASSDGTTRLWDLSRRITIATLHPRAGATNGVAFSPNGRLLATCHANETVKLWSSRTFEQLASFGGFSESAARLAFSPDGKMLAAACHDKKVRVKNVRSMINGQNR